MSFDVYLQCYEYGRAAGIPRTSVRRLFPVIEAQSGRDYWQVRYDELHACTIYLATFAADDQLVSSLTLNRPCGMPQFWDSVLTVMRMGNVVLYFPGCLNPLVANEFVGAHLPADMLEALGRPRCVQSGQEIVDIIEHS